MFQFVKDNIKWLLQASKQYIQYHYLSNNRACAGASIKHGFKWINKIQNTEGKKKS